MELIESARAMLEFNVTSEGEAQLDPKDKDSDWESFNSVEQRRLLAASLGAKKKQTYRLLKEGMPIRNPNWKAIAMTSFDFEDNPFWRIW